MGTISSEEELDQLRERFEFDSYTSSADVSESKSSSSFSCHHYEHQRASTSSPPFLDRFFSPPSLPIMLPVVPGKHVMMKMEENLSDVEMMKERFAKLLLGEDMSGGGKGVCTALAISNAITNLSASVFGELRKLEPLAPQKKSMWHREMDLLLCVSDSIVELVPSMQNLPGGGTFEVMVPRPRLDLFMNLPALKKLETMLLSILDGFCDAEFYYVDRGVIVAGGNETETFSLSSSSARPSISREEKWWLPFPKVPQNGLSEDARKRLQQCKECTNQILKVAMAINGSVLTEMEIPSAINGSVLTEMLCQQCTIETCHQNTPYWKSQTGIEAAAHIWRKRYLKGYKAQARAQRKSTWRGRVKGFVGEVERNKLLARRAETLLHSLRLRFPALPQTTLDSYKIQYNKDVGHAIIESYSRVMESLAYNILARIGDLLYVDDATKQRAAAESTSLYDQERLGGGALSKQRQISPSPFSFQHSFSGSSCPLSNLDSSHDKIRTPNGHDFTKKSNLRNSPIQTLQKLTF
ncbi:Rop guanine nucleotide exchange factor, putative [Ricinus communis]|uniref:Rop guanine nucleotide exchange factor, putative n=1 Tax=Ricinus communis TaxID=3988 RepID=B9R8H9_RICCO|nr:Rop guanine nucleotide exchange factor, putative [Ricinus communis]